MPDDEFQFIDPFDDAPAVIGHELLRNDGLRLRSPGELRPGELRGCLWEVIYALAARRIYLHSTDHLSDSELYAWLYDEWLPRETADLPFEAGWNCHVDLVGAGSEADNQIWLKFYADEELRVKWKRDFPEDHVPEYEPAPYDRDRWLPRPPAHESLPEQDESGELPAAATEEEASVPFDELQDPLQLEVVDREIRRERPVFDLEQADDERTSAFGRREEAMEDPAVEIETGRWTCPHEELVRSGVVLPPPEEMTDEMIPALLWELLHELACRGFYLLHTDHLTDRELYSRLWRQDLREPAILPGRSSSGGWYHDCVGSGSREDNAVWLRFYANDRDRERHALDHPGDALPLRVERPCRRDHRLPKGPL